MKTRFKDTTNLTSKTNIKSVSRIPSSFNSSQSSHFYLPLSAPLINSNLYNKKRPLETNSQNLSFKGLSFLYKQVNKEPIVAEELLKIADKHLGPDIRALHDDLIDPNKVASKYARKMLTVENGKITFFQKTIPHLIYDGIVYPFKILPADLLNGAVKSLKKIKPLEKWADGVYESQMFKNIRQRSKIDAKVNALMGALDDIEKNKGLLEDELTSSLFKTSVKTFDVKTGNYDTKHERSLNRIVSGSIPAVFLANDAYNLSRMCNDNEKEASEEKKIRFRQETSRVLVQAYITLITMGAIQKHINSSKFAVMANVGLTALFTESISRLLAGKNIVRISSKKAKELNSKNQGEKPVQASQAPTKGAYNGVFFKSAKSKSFAAFRGLEPMTASKPIEKETVKTTKPENADKKAPLLSFSNLIKGIVGAAVLGFAGKGLSQNKVIAEQLEKLAKSYKNIYTKITVKPDTRISTEQFEEILTKLRDAGHDVLAGQYKAIAKKNNLYSEDGKSILLGARDKKYLKPVIDFIVGPVKFTWGILRAPYYWTNKLINAVTKQLPKEVKKETTEIEAFRKSIDCIGKEALKKKFDAAAFKDYVTDNRLKAFNKNNVSGIANSDLANLSKTAVFATTLPFLMADNYNIVMMKSNGEDKEGADLKYKERLVQESSRFFYSTLLISLFNNALQSQYHKSLFGMSWITAVCSVVSEVLNRKSVGVPVGTYSRDQILEMEKQRENASPMVKGYYNFMARLTGKKSLAEQQQAKMQSKNPAKTVKA